MTVYQSAAVILPDFTDEALASPDSPYGPQLRELLLSIPAEFRQPAAAEQHRRSTHVSHVETKGGLAARDEPIRPAMEAWREVVAEVAHQVAKADAR